MRICPNRRMWISADSVTAGGVVVVSLLIVSPLARVGVAIGVSVSTKVGSGVSCAHDTRLRMRQHDKQDARRSPKCLGMSVTPKYRLGKVYEAKCKRI